MRHFFWACLLFVSPLLFADDFFSLVKNAEEWATVKNAAGLFQPNEVKLAVTAGINIDERGINGRTPLMIVAGSSQQFFRPIAYNKNI